jgi:TolB protein
MNPDGSQLERLTDDSSFDYGPHFSPDGQKIVFASRRGGLFQLYIMNPDGTDTTRLTESEGNDYDPRWSPDGAQITFSSDRDGDVEIFVINVDGSSERQLTNNDTFDVSPIWSPDGQWIAYSASDNTEGADDPNIILMRPDGSEVTRITLSPSYDGDAVSWSPDSEWLIIPSQRVGNYELYALRLADRKFGALTRTAGDEFSGFLSADGRYLLINAFYEDYTGLLIQDLSTGETTQLTVNTTASSASWYHQEGVVFDGSWLEQALLPDEICTYSTDESYGFTAENPIPIGNGPSFGGPFDGMNLYTYVRGATDVAQRWGRGHIFPANSQGDTLDTLIITTEDDQAFTLYVNLFDYSIPEIPVGMYCDLEYP